MSSNALLPKQRTGSLLCTAFAARLAILIYALVHFHAAWFFSRGSEMGFLANSLVHGLGLSSPFGPPTGSTAMVAPGYPIFVALIFKIFGSYTLWSALVLMLWNLAANLTTVVLIYRISQKLASETAAFWVALFWSCSLPLLWMPTIFWETSLSSALLLGFVAAMLSAGSQDRPRFWLLYGAMCAVAGLLNPALLPCLIALIGYTIYRAKPKELRPIVLTLLSFALVFCPWPLRNAHAFHAPVLTRTTVGLELWMGNHPDSSGYLDESLFPTYNKRELADYKLRGELGYTSHKQQLARTYIEAHPGITLHLTARRLFRFWTGTGNAVGSPIFALHAVFTTLMGFAGLLLIFRARNKDRWLFLMPILIFPLPYYVTHAEFRYRLVLDPLLTILGAVSLDSCRHLKRNPRANSRAETTRNRREDVIVAATSRTTPTYPEEQPVLPIAASSLS